MIQYRTKDRVLRSQLEQLSELLEDQLTHASSHHVGGSDQINFSSITGFSDYLDQAVKTTSSPIFQTIKLVNLSDGYVPYHVSDSTGLANSQLYISSENKVGIGLTNPFCKLSVHGAGLFRLHEAQTEAGLLVFQDLNGNWLGSINGYIVAGSYGFLKFYDYYGGSWNCGITHKGGAIGINKDPDYANYKLDINGNAQISGKLDISFFKNKARAYRNSNQSTTNNTWIQVQLNAEDYDPNNNFDSTTNYCYTIPATGYYQIHAQVTFGSIQAGRYIIAINDGFDRVLNEHQFQTVSNYETLIINDILYFTSGSQVKLYAYQNTGGNTPIIYGGITRTFMTICPVLHGV